MGLKEYRYRVDESEYMTVLHHRIQRDGLEETMKKEGLTPEDIEEYQEWQSNYGVTALKERMNEILRKRSSD